ncbi:MAG TPA: SPOR domain-containing protein [Ignavibacteria bacterium]|nr:SPOR domain-containing protein [Ignavibacteria bacterium]
MNKDELVIKLAEEFGISTIDIYHFVNTVVESMQKAFRKGKNVNITEFGKFNVLTRKNDKGESFKTLSFSPVRKFAEDINFRFNNLSSIPLKSGMNEPELTEVINTDNNQKTLNYTIMSDKDKYDDNLIRDEFPEDSSMDSIEAFIRSKLEKGTGSKEVNTDDEIGGMKEFELPHTIIELHNDITGEDVIEETPSQIQDATENSDPSGSNENDLAKIIEERKKALVHTSTEDSQSNISDTPVEESGQVVNENRDSFNEFKNFDEERNAELSKIIEERNKIISDINSMVHTSENYVSEEPKQEISNNYEGFPSDIEEKIEETTDNKIETPDETPDKTPIENPIDNAADNNTEKENVKEITYEQPVQNEISEITNDIKEEIERNSFPQDHSLEHKPAIEDNFDPIVTSDEIDTPLRPDEDLTGNDILINEDVENLQQNPVENYNPIEEPKSFEDVFVTKSEVTADSFTPPPVSGESQMQPPVNPIPPVKQETYQERMQKRREMYEKKEGSSKKTLWMIIGFIALIILVVFLYNYFVTPPPVNNADNTAQNNNETPGEVKNTPPPVEEKKSEETPNKSEQTQNPPASTSPSSSPPSSSPPSGEEIIPDNQLKIVYVRTSEGFYIQTGSFKDKSVADSKAKQIKANGKTVAVKEADLGEKGIYYRVRIGLFKTQEEAKEFASGL